jgi:nucleoside-diphosphate-sugar epimerase
VLLSAPSGALLVTGASGYVGGLAVTAVLHRTDRLVVAPVRAERSPAQVRQELRAEYQASCGPWTEAIDRRLIFVPLDGDLLAAIRTHGVDEILHCAGCLDYFDSDKLHAVNVGLTEELLQLAARAGLRRFVYMSTAFASGFRTDLVPETLHPESDELRDPTAYTRSKRLAEHKVAASGLPYLVLRPSIVVGDSRDGHYSGKSYGLYQLWSGMERFCSREWYPVFHTVAPPIPLNLIHQDALQEGIVAALSQAQDGSVVHLVSPDGAGPDLRELSLMWLRDYMCPREVFLYQRLADVPLRAIPPRQRAVLSLGRVNLEIAAHRWRFETAGQRALEAGGARLPSADLGTVGRCQRRFAEGSPSVCQLLASRPELRGAPMSIVDVPSQET